MEKSRSGLEITSDDHVAGEASAPVTLIQYADYRCPFSAQALRPIEQTLNGLRDKVRFVYRQFPLVQLHPGSYELSQFAEAVAKQGHFWRAHELLFNVQQSLDDQTLGDFLTRFKIDESKLNHDMKSEEIKAKIARDMETGKELGVKKTPTFLVNGKLFQDEWHQSGMRDQILSAVNAR